MLRTRLTRLLAAALLVVGGTAWSAAARQASLPNAQGSVKFAVIGDSGNGDPEQFQVAEQMRLFHGRFAFDRVIMLGDNIYGGQGPKDLERKFAVPYKALLDAGVKFYASLGNHDDPNNRQYPLWNMGGQRYYTHGVRNVRFFAIDSDLLDRPQLTWLEKALKDSKDDWKICYFHHPLYSNGKTHGASVELRVVLEPLFVATGVNVVFSGHDHTYERLVPQKGIYYFVEGASGQLRKGDIRRSASTAAGFDQDESFMLVEIAGNELTFQAISRTGAVVDSGTIHRQVRGSAR